MPNINAAAPDAQLPRSLVLVVDDNQQNVELIQAYLEGLDCTTDVAVDGVAALEKVAAIKPDLIILDIMMPRMSGFEVCRRIKASPETRAVPILMVTALHEIGDIEKGVESGTDDFLSKPINKLELITRVKTLLRVRHLQSQLERTMAYLAEIESSERRS